MERLVVPASQRPLLRDMHGPTTRPCGVLAASRPRPPFVGGLRRVPSPRGADADGEVPPAPLCMTTPHRRGDRPRGASHPPLAQRGAPQIGRLPRPDARPRVPLFTAPASRVRAPPFAAHAPCYRSRCDTHRCHDQAHNGGPGKVAQERVRSGFMYRFP